MNPIAHEKYGAGGRGVEVHPEVFEIIAAGSGRVRVEAPGNEAEASCRQAEQDCPAQAGELDE